MKHAKKHWAKHIVQAIFTLFFVYVIVVLMFENVALFNRYQHYVIGSGSMAPTIDVGDVVVIDRRVKASSLEVGDIIAFHEPEPDSRIIVHRVHAIDVVEGERVFETIAEISDQPDDWLIQEADIIGVYRFHVPRLGRFLMFAQSPIGRIVIVLDIILIYILYRWLIKPNPKKT